MLFWALNRSLFGGIGKWQTMWLNQIAIRNTVYRVPFHSCSSFWFHSKISPAAISVRSNRQSFSDRFSKILEKIYYLFSAKLSTDFNYEISIHLLHVYSVNMCAKYNQAKLNDSLCNQFWKTLFRMVFSFLGEMEIFFGENPNKS